MYLDKGLTLGRLRKRLEPVVAFSPRASRQLQGAIEARNYLMHHFYKLNMSRWQSGEGRSVMLGIVKLFHERIDLGASEAVLVYQAWCSALGWPPHELISQLLTDNWELEDPAGNERRAEQGDEADEP